MEGNVAPPEVAYGFIGLGNIGSPMVECDISTWEKIMY
jgi:hypothetical protein